MLGSQTDRSGSKRKREGRREVVKERGQERKGSGYRFGNIAVKAELTRGVM